MISLQLSTRCSNFGEENAANFIFTFVSNSITYVHTTRVKILEEDYILFGLDIQISRRLGDPPGVWVLNSVLSIHGSSVKPARPLVGDTE